MTRWMPNLYMLRMSMRIVNGAADVDKWQAALMAALKNHPVFEMQIDRHGMQYITSSSASILEGRYHNIQMQKDDGDLLIAGQINRILGDGTSMAILLDDIRRAYNGEPLQS